MSDPGNGAGLDPAVVTFIAAVNAHDRDAFNALLAPAATMSDDGRDRDLSSWVAREIFSAGARMEVEEVLGPCDLVADYRNDRWGSMRTRWHFHIVAGKVGRFETGQA